MKLHCTFPIETYNKSFKGLVYIILPRSPHVKYRFGVQL